MKKTLAVINDLKKQGIIEDYAIGGGIAAINYIEPILTYDLDVFVILSKTSDKHIVDLSKLFDELRKKEYQWQKEHIIIEGVPVQFIPADALEIEAIHNSIEIDYEGIPARIFSAEYLIAILVRAGRAKDIDKVRKLLEQAAIDHKKLKAILVQYDLVNKYQEEFQSYEKKQ
ncbi:hypothetical protein JXB22_02215 [candidate division WOR-3 bacterium]|nr:hypothetical protein [candidate division WOR-3 bacterium]